MFLQFFLCFLLYASQCVAACPVSMVSIYEEKAVGESRSPLTHESSLPAKSAADHIVDTLLMHKSY
jgi:Fe-S-cluster-containing hydrogenase component 2